jgi:hypothetical protein
MKNITKSVKALGRVIEVLLGEHITPAEKTLEDIKNQVRL